MQFDSLIYALFLPIVFLLYWSLHRKHYRYQNFLLIIASYVFYGWWDWRFLGLIAFNTISTYSLALLCNGSRNRKFATIASVVINLGILCTFKYYNFFSEALTDALAIFGISVSLPALKVVLPIGISFYTFQAISYSVDVYRRTIKPTKDNTAFATYMAFFPQLVAGPIEKASNLLPQFLQPRVFDYTSAVIGMRQILWGLAKKIIISDYLSGVIHTMLYNPASQNSATLILGNLYFAIQIYVDFSAYSDIAIGSARLFGIRLSANFRYPFFSRNIGELWRRWHMTLISWLRDYIYIPLGGSRKGNVTTCLNILIVFLLSGLWHGASWTFIVWGLLNGLFIILTRYFSPKKPTSEPTFKDLPAMLFTTLIMTFCIIPFRCASMADYFHMLSCILTGAHTAAPIGLKALLYIVPFFAIEWVARRQEFPLYKMPKSRITRWCIYWGLLLLIAYSCSSKTVQYIYFQF